MDAVDHIRETCDIVLKITPVNGEGGMGFLNKDLGGTKLNMKAFTLMCNQFAIIIKAGIPISRTVHLIAAKTTDKNLKRILNQVAGDVESGRSVAASFEERGGKLLPPTFIETIRAGEESGSLDSAFQSVGDHLDKQTKMAGKVKSALSYPAFVMVIAIAVVVVLMVKVVPTFTSIFDSYGAELPAITKSLIALSNFFTKYWMVLLGIGVAIFLFYKIYGNTEEGRLKFAQWQLKLPVLGEIAELNSASQFANSMATMLKAGLPMTKSISITAKVIDNYFISQEVGKYAGKLEEGRSLGASMRESGVMPDILIDMVSVGEETGEMESTLTTIANYYDVELETAVAAAIAKLEPALLVVLAGIAGYIVIAIYMSIFSMYSVM
ncbi:MAG: type II secretion system F family protein [Oscillospiraceae bacterium]|nr:type II secretion system F family protein [Oscillospiraceae bacterium]